MQAVDAQHGSLGSAKDAAVQVRANMETMQADGSANPSGGTLGYAGFRPSSNFDSLLTKVVGYASAGGLEAAMRRTARALSDFRIVGVDTNIPFRQALLAH